MVEASSPRAARGELTLSLMKYMTTTWPSRTTAENNKRDRPHVGHAIPFPCEQRLSPIYAPTGRYSVSSGHAVLTYQLSLQTGNDTGQNQRKRGLQPSSVV